MRSMIAISSFNLISKDLQFSIQQKSMQWYLAFTRTIRCMNYVNSHQRKLEGIDLI